MQVHIFIIPNRSMSNQTLTQAYRTVTDPTDNISIKTCRSVKLKKKRWNIMYWVLRGNPPWGITKGVSRSEQHNRKDNCIGLNCSGTSWNMSKLCSSVRASNHPPSLSGINCDKLSTPAKSISAAADAHMTRGGPPTLNCASPCVRMRAARPGKITLGLN